MVYTFVCDDCNLVPIDVYRSSADSDAPEECQSCNQPMRKVFHAVPTTFKSVYDGAQYNPAFGKVVNGKAGIKEELNRIKGETGRELHEVGNDSTMDNWEPERKSYDDDLADRIKI